MHSIFNWKFFTWKFTVGAAVVIVALCVGIFLYAQWDVQRFTESLGEPPVPSKREVLTEKSVGQVSPAAVSETTSISENPQQQGLDLVQPMLDAEIADSVELVVDPETTDSDAQELLDAELDALLEMFEQQALSTLREAVDIEDEELDNTELVEAIEEEYGPSPEVDVLSEMMEHIEEGTTTLDNLIEMVEASSTIMHENMPEGAISLLEMLRTAQANGGLIVTEFPDGGTAFIMGASGASIDKMINGGSVELEFRGTDGTKMQFDLEGASVIK